MKSPQIVYTVKNTKTGKYLEYDKGWGLTPCTWTNDIFLAATFKKWEGQKKLKKNMKFVAIMMTEVPTIFVK